MIKYINGNLLDESHNFEVIGHCANCFCTMGSGIAPQIKNKYPEAYEVDCKTIKGDKNKLGTISYTINTKPIVCNLYGQFDFRGRLEGKIDLDYDALKSALILMKEKFSGKRIGLPYIGTGLAGGDEAKVIAIIKEVLEGEDVTMVRYAPVK